jgi:hypothetical protein
MPAMQDVEWHSRRVDDWYTPALALNAAAFLYCALFCQRVLTDDSAVDALSSGRMLPAVDLVLLIFLFTNITLDRVAYSVGSNAGKAALHVLEVPVYVAGAWLLCWNPRSSVLDRFHLRVRALSLSLQELCCNTLHA